MAMRPTLFDVSATDNDGHVERVTDLIYNAIRAASHKCWRRRAMNTSSKAINYRKRGEADHDMGTIQSAASAHHDIREVGE